MKGFRAGLRLGGWVAVPLSPPAALPRLNPGTINTDTQDLPRYLRHHSLFTAFTATAPLVTLAALAFAAPPATSSSVVAGTRADASTTAADGTRATAVFPMVAKYCVPCHGSKDPPGGIDLTHYHAADEIARDADVWRRVRTQLRERTMPPAVSPQVPDDARDRAIGALDSLLNTMAVSAPNPGRVLIHRLNRAEYNNTIRDLTGVDTRPADAFPADGGGGGGFDNNADTLFLPPILMERYLGAAGDVLRAARTERIEPIRPSASSSARAAARTDIARFATRAFRRPVAAEEVDRLLTLYDRASARKADFNTAVGLALKAVLIAPEFLFRVEQDPASANAPRAVSDYELASRLSYFLWSSMPDDELFRTAASGRLHEPAVLDAQMARMLRDPKSRAFSEDFVGQWLRVRDLYTVARPDPGHFPEFTPALRDALYREPILLFADIIGENSSLRQLIDSPYAYLNGPLAAYYGIDGVTGPEMRRVTLRNHARGGVVTSGAVLTLTSFPLRTSPVLRGKWVLEQILGTPVPPPPPTVPTLSADDKPSAAGLTFRQRLEQHRSKPACAGCHSRMDPLGFGLENYDAIGRWRDKVGGAPVDASGVLTTGEKFTGPAELKGLILARKDAFARNLTEKMLSYSLGRGLEVYDTPAVDKITAALKRDDYHAQTLIREIVNSYPFRFRAAPGGGRLAGRESTR